MCRSSKIIPFVENNYGVLGTSVTLHYKSHNYIINLVIMYTKIRYISFVSLCLIVSCTTTNDQGEVVDEGIRISISNDENELSKRITMINKPLRLIYSDSQDKISQNQQDDAWDLVAEVATPVVSGEKLSATHVEIIDNRAYVSYHKRGHSHIGAIEIFDLPSFTGGDNTVRSISKVDFLTADVNAIALDSSGSTSNRKLWVSLSDFNEGAVLAQIFVEDGVFKRDNSVQHVNLSEFASTGISASANGVVRADNLLFVTAGKTHGGTFLLNANTLAFSSAEEYPNAKYVATNGNEVVTLITGDQAALKVRSADGSGPTQTFDIGSISHQNVPDSVKFRGKSTLFFNQNFPDVAFATMGSAGLKGFDITNGQERFSTLPGMLGFGNTNGAISDADSLIYMANGADGLSVAKIPESGGELRVLFKFDLEDEMNASANHVAANGQFVFVAKGLEGGLKILRKRLSPPPILPPPPSL